MTTMTTMTSVVYNSVTPKSTAPADVSSVWLWDIWWSCFYCNLVCEYDRGFKTILPLLHSAGVTPRKASIKLFCLSVCLSVCLFFSLL